MIATPVSASAAPANGSRSTEVTRPLTPRISWRARIESGSFFRGQRIGLFNTDMPRGRRMTAARIGAGNPQVARVRSLVGFARFVGSIGGRWAKSSRKRAQ